MQQNNDSRWNHKLSALALAILLTAFLAFGQYYRGIRGARPSVSAVAPAAPVVAVIIVKRKARGTALAEAKVAVVNAPVAQGGRLREKGEALGGGKEEQEEAAAENAGK